MQCKVKLYGVSDAWKKLLPSANFLVKYNKKETGDALQGDSALELTAAKYGRDEWWLLLEPAPAYSRRVSCQRATCAKIARLRRAALEIGAVAAGSQFLNVM